MRETWKLDLDRILAWIIVAVVHVLLGLGLIRLLVIKRMPTEPGSALQLAWIPVPAKPVIPSRPLPTRDATGPVIGRTKPAATTQVNAASGAATDIASSIDPVEAVPGSLSAVFVDQAARWARQQAPLEFGAPDPFNRKPAELPGRPTRLRIRERPTLADAVGAIGQLFGGPGYTTDPCTELRKDVNDLSLAGDSAALQDALYYEKRACH